MTVAMAERKVRKLSPAQVAQAQWEYEHTTCSQRYLATKFGVHRGAIEYWIEVGRWVKYAPPGPPKKRSRRQAEAFEREVKAAEGHAHDAVLAEGLAASIEPKPAKAGVRSAATAPPEPAADRPAAPVAAQPSAPAPAVERAAVTSQPAKDKRPGASVIPFPGAKPPPQKGDKTLFPKRSQAEEAELRVQLSSLRGHLSIQQLHQLERHERILSDFSHLLSVYLSPHEYLDVDGLEEEDAQEKLLKVQRAALSLLLPSEGDSLAGALKALTTSLATTINLKRAVGGLGKSLARGGRGDDEDAPEPKPGGNLAQLGTEALRSVKAAMLVLTGEQIRQSDPPRPPAPESLEDLRGVDLPE
jgi:hypothetical protein